MDKEGKTRNGICFDMCREQHSFKITSPIG